MLYLSQKCFCPHWDAEMWTHDLGRRTLMFRTACDTTPLCRHPLYVYKFERKSKSSFSCVSGSSMPQRFRCQHLRRPQWKGTTTTSYLQSYKTLLPENTPRWLKDHCTLFSMGNSQHLYLYFLSFLPGKKANDLHETVKRLQLSTATNCKQYCYKAPWLASNWGILIFKVTILPTVQKRHKQSLPYMIAIYNSISVTRLGDLLDFGQLFQAFGNDSFVKISHILRQFL